MNKMEIGTYLSIITLNVNEVSASIKRPGVAEWIKNKTQLYAVYKWLASDLKAHRQKVKGWKIALHENRNENKAMVAIVIPEKIEFKIKTVTRDKEGCYIMIKGLI